MKAKIMIVALVIVLLGLLWAFRQRARQTEAQRENFQASIQLLSNDLNLAHQKLDDQTKDNNRLETVLSTRAEEVQSLTERLLSLTNRLEKTLQQAQAEAEAARTEISRRDAKIAELEGERDGLTRRMTELNASITDLETRIAETQRKLDASEGDREFLLGELKRLQAEKAELERQFSDLAVLREQVRRLKDELSIARRLEWLRRGLYGTEFLKGAERLQRGFSRPAPVRTNVDLNVEIRPDGSATILNPTNRPPPAPTP
jgi:chromosome segregation ATPase